MGALEEGGRGWDPPPLPKYPWGSPQHSGPDSSPKAFPSLNAGPDRMSNRQKPPPPLPLSHPLQPLDNRSGTAPFAPLPFKQSSA